MTRDEARFALQGPLGEHFGHKVPEGVDDAWINCLVALGILKLDEPEMKRGPDEIFRDAFRAMDADNRKYLMNVQACIDRAGLKLVEK